MVRDLFQIQLTQNEVELGLFDHEFPDLFEWVVAHMGDLPLARRSSKSQRPNPFHLEGFPA